jgi:hypothetical protein
MGGKLAGIFFGKMGIFKKIKNYFFYIKPREAFGILFFLKK